MFGLRVSLVLNWRGLYKCLIFPVTDPVLSPDSAGWVGAWWFGSVIISGAVCLLSLPLVVFPRKLKQQQQDENKKPRPPSQVSRASSQTTAEKLRPMLQTSVTDLTDTQTAKGGAYNVQFYLYFLCIVYNDLFFIYSNLIYKKKLRSPLRAPRAPECHQV